MAEYESKVSKDVAEKIISDLIDELEFKTYGKVDAGVPFFVGTFQWLNPELADIVNSKGAMCEFLAGIFAYGGASEDEIIKMATNLYEYYDDSDLISDYRDEDGY